LLAHDKDVTDTPSFSDADCDSQVNFSR
jgi:hypothetical protein